jgi:hypothetical protein
LLPCEQVIVVGKPMVPQLSAVMYMEGGVHDTPVLQGSAGEEVAFAAVYPPQLVIGAVESQKFGNGAFPNSEWSLAGLGRPQELVNGVEVLQLLCEHDLPAEGP